MANGTSQVLPKLTVAQKVSYTLVAVCTFARVFFAAHTWRWLAQLLPRSKLFLACP